MMYVNDHQTMHVLNISFIYPFEIRDQACRLLSRIRTCLLGHGIPKSRSQYLVILKSKFSALANVQPKKQNLISDESLQCDLQSWINSFYTWFLRKPCPLVDGRTGRNREQIYCSFLRRSIKWFKIIYRVEFGIKLKRKSQHFTSYAVRISPILSTFELDKCYQVHV